MADPNKGSDNVTHSRSLKSSPGDATPLNVQDLLLEVYGNSSGEPVSAGDSKIAADTDSSLCFGEVLPRGVTKILDENHLNCSEAKYFYDLGMGLGKLAMQAFLQFPNLEYVVGVELAYTRFEKAVTALEKLSKLKPPTTGITWRFKTENGNAQLLEEISVYENGTPTKKSKYSVELKCSNTRQRILEFRRANFFDVPECKNADILICETKIRKTKWRELCMLLNTLQKGTKLLTYEELAAVYKTEKLELPWNRLSINTQCDLFPVSWSADGHHFDLFEKLK